MSDSVLVFVSHSSADKESYVEPIVNDLEDCFINVWIDKRKIPPGQNLRKSIFRSGLDKADVALLFFTKNSLNSAWVDLEIKHVLREELKRGSSDLNKIISIFDSEDTYEQISERYPELTDDLLHLMPKDYDKNHLGKLISAIWSKYFSLQGGDIETQRQLLEKDQEIFQKEKEIQVLKSNLENYRHSNQDYAEFEIIQRHPAIAYFEENKKQLLSGYPVSLHNPKHPEVFDLIGLGLLEPREEQDDEGYEVTYGYITERGVEYCKWQMLFGQTDQ
ncbi:toll/interleukin-1 receptor domain-containing protein [Gimesia maris]|uniref:toll/interleukin-1 receptor domain-containing protein n=1 Tax=Gimesia maris TaxID=122 RepID=UPI0032EE249B